MNAIVMTLQHGQKLPIFCEIQNARESRRLGFFAINEENSMPTLYPLIMGRRSVIA
jgi:hypothetical protein